MLYTLDKPIYLIIYLLIPLIWLMMKRLSAGELLSKKQIAIGILRSLLIIVLGLALADPKHLRHSDQVNVFFCLDISESIPVDQRLKAEAFIEQAAAAMQAEDQAGLIVFGRHPAIEVSLKTNLEALNIKSIVNPHNTNILSLIHI